MRDRPACLSLAGGLRLGESTRDVFVHQFAGKFAASGAVEFGGLAEPLPEVIVDPDVADRGSSWRHVSSVPTCAGCDQARLNVSVV